MTALHPIDSQLFSQQENVLPRHTELVTDLLISECWIGKHRAEAEKCSLAVMVIKAGGTYHVLDLSLLNILSSIAHLRMGYAPVNLDCPDAHERTLSSEAGPARLYRTDAHKPSANLAGRRSVDVRG